MHRFLVAGCLMGLLSLSKSVSASPAAIAPYVDDYTFAVVHVKVKQVDLDAAWKKIEELLPDPEVVKGGQAVKEVVAQAREVFLQTGAKELYLLLNWADPLDGGGLVVVPIPDGTDKNVVAKALARLFDTNDPQVKIQGNVVLVGKERTLKAVGKMQAKKRLDISAALDAAGDAPIRVGAFVPDALRKAIQENVPNLPRQLGGASTDVLTKGVLWIAASWNPKESLAPKLMVQAKDAQAAEDLLKLYKEVVDAAANLPDIRDEFPDFAKLMESIQAKLKGDRLVLAIDEKFITQALGPALAKVREAAARNQSVNNLKQIGLAMHAYHDTHKSFPAASSYDAQGKGLLSWRVHILPYIEQGPLYQQFKLDEPWDSDHNKKLIAQIPVIYRSPLSRAPDGKTTYLVPIGPKTIFEKKKGISVAKITDGTSNTILVVEADDGKAVTWTQPEDYKIDAKNPLAGLVRKGAKGFLVSFADGSVRVLPATIHLDALRAMFTANGGEVINEETD